MRAQIVLFGTSHSLQCGTDKYTSPQLKRFRSRIRQVCQAHKIALVAEEMSSDGLAHYGKTITVVARLAGNLRIQHKFVDLTTAERANLGIDDGSLSAAAMHLGSGDSAKHLRDELVSRLSYPVRERCWLARILAFNVWPSLFICGAHHVGNMGCLIGSIGQDAIVAERDYEPQRSTVSLSIR
jgi:hypothetical protein